MRDGTKTKETIDSTAMRLFVEKGIAETTVREIATAAGIAEGTLYRHYPSKEELSWSVTSRRLGPR
jgi:AcrR family transcriptional regulator